MKIFSVFVTNYHEDDENISYIFPRAFRTRAEAKHTIDEDALEQWTELQLEGKFRGVSRLYESDRGESYSIDIGEGSSLHYEIVEQEFE